MDFSFDFFCGAICGGLFSCVFSGVFYYALNKSEAEYSNMLKKTFVYLEYVLLIEKYDTLFYKYTTLKKNYIEDIDFVVAYAKENIDDPQRKNAIPLSMSANLGFLYSGAL